MKIVYYQLPSRGSDLTTTDALQTVQDFPVRGIGLAAVLVLKNSGGANGATFRVLGSVDDGGTFDVTVVADTNVAAGATTKVSVSEPYDLLRVQAKSQTAGQATTVNCKGVAS